MKHLLLALFLVPFLGMQAAASASAALNPDTISDDYTAYPLLYGAPAPALAAAPAGYEPVYLSHYGRHGSRHLIGSDVYSGPLAIFERAAAADALTPLGQRLLGDLRALAAYGKGHTDELTPLGHSQHRGIARRMVQRWPVLFQPGDSIDCRSSTVVRCILSMSSAVGEIRSMAPQVRLSVDASESDMRELVNGDTATCEGLLRQHPEAETAWRAFRDSIYSPDRLMNSLFRTPADVKQYVKDPFDLAIYKLWSMAANAQSLAEHRSLWYLFPDADELRRISEMCTAWWYIYYGPSPLTASARLRGHAPLVARIVREADAALSAPAATACRANLRYGHDSILMPLVSALGLNGWGRQMPLAELYTRGWRDQWLVPMAGNVQLVFFRNKAGDVLVQPLLHERQAAFDAVKPAYPGFYRWQDVKTQLANSK